MHDKKSETVNPCAVKFGLRAYLLMTSRHKEVKGKHKVLYKERGLNTPYMYFIQYLSKNLSMINSTVIDKV